ncbi:MAG: rhodanese-like domain-containing protein [Deltaproteobacteria bacterium]|nr:rhodanese-like domain-containing protein [Deltaproteobacteria bacterium]MBW2306732.1 rhodanese-like domain-containing protein [Deltaproteobacteria bacterium]
MEPLKISQEEAKERLDRGENIFFLDVRGHPDDHKIKGALVVPPAEVAAQADRIPRNKTIITYCT